MKIFLYSIAIIALCLTAMSHAQTNSPASAAHGNLPTTIFDWEKMAVTPTTNGVRRALFDSPSATLDLVHCHITTLNPGQNSGEPRKHLQEEVIIVKEGLVEATWDGHTQTIGPGSVIFFAANAVTRLRNAGDQPCTYTVVYFHTPLTPKN